MTDDGGKRKGEKSFLYYGFYCYIYRNVKHSTLKLISMVKFYKCPHCGNIHISVIDSGVVPVCCGSEMKELVAGETDGAREKHVPVVTRKSECSVLVEVGSVPHPMLPEHHISFIYLETACGGQLRRLEPGKPAVAEFCDCKDPVVAVYEYCNLHGLWKTEV